MTITKREMLASVIAFRNTFDPLHPSYHRGDPRPVLINGQRIPAGCEEETDEYQKLKIERDTVKQIKNHIINTAKSISLLSGFYKTLNYKEPEDIIENLKELRNLMQHYSRIASDPYKERVKHVIISSFKVLKSKPSTRDEYGNFLFEVNQLSRQLFSIESQQLRELKKLKTNLDI